MTHRAATLAVVLPAVLGLGSLTSVLPAQAASTPTAAALSLATAERSAESRTAAAVQGQRFAQAAAPEESNAEVSRLERELGGAQAEAEALKESLAAARARLAEMLSERDRSIAALRDRLADATAEVTELKALLADAGSESEQLRAALADERDRNRELAAAGVDARFRFASLEQRLAQAEGEAEVAHEQLGARAARIAELEAAVEAGEASAEELDAALADERERSRELAAAGVDARFRFASLEQRLAQAEGEAEVAHEQLAALRATAERAAAEQQARLEDHLTALDAEAGNGLRLLVPGDLLFDFDSAEVKSGAVGRLWRIAELIGFFENGSVEIVGHTDAIGSPTYNQALSERRADAVRAFLVDNFAVPENRLVVTGMGPTQPIADNDTAAGRSMNRRVEVVVHR